MSFESLEKKHYSRKRARTPDVEPAVLTRREEMGLKKLNRTILYPQLPRSEARNVLEVGRVGDLSRFASSRDPTLPISFLPQAFPAFSYHPAQALTG